MIRKILKFIGWLVAGTLGVTLLFYLVLVVINWRDASPSEAAMHFMQLHAQRPTVADEENGYVYLVGMSVKPELDPKEAGLVMVKRSRGTNIDVHAHPDYPQVSLTGLLGKELQEIKDECRSFEDKCLPLLARDNMPVIEADRIGKIFLTRYRELLSHPLWQDIYTKGFDSPIPSYSVAIYGQLLSMIDAMQHATERNPAEIMASLERDAAYWRNVLISSDSLITSMVATSNLKRNMMWSNLILKKLLVEKSFEGSLSVWAVAIERDERQMMRAWAGEMALIDYAIKNTTTEGFYKLITAEIGEVTESNRLVDKLAEPLLLQQVTFNRIAESRLSLIRSLDVSYDAIPDAVLQIKDSYAANDHGISFPGVLRNPVGKIAEANSPSNDLPYMLMVADLEGGRRALLATLELRSNKTPRHKVAEALAASPWRNPYSNEPFTWDEATGSVIFAGLSEGEGKRYLFPY